MSRLPIISTKDVVRVLKRAGFTYAPKRGKGSHIAFYKVDENGRKCLVIVPHRRDIPKGTLMSIIEQSGLTKDDFIALL
ncbi:type II toxin-antitoxin system HicA family toxin [Candidatus Peregrinibacteria bacterium]|nr:type II toxin-antitoxin system HicA family toxin [Candidatus Peregrinibacteria bacterium]